MNLAIFDLDNTLIGGDSDHLWGEFLVEHNYVDQQSYKQANDQYYQDYLDGILDMHAYQKFVLTPIKGKTPQQLTLLHQQFMREKILPIMLVKANTLIDEHKAKADRLLIITATNRFITHPIAKALKIDEMLATEPELVDGKYSGNITGTPCYQHGKVERFKAWQSSQHSTFENIYFYSDSFNDLPLLSEVSHPVAVDPDEKLKQHASEQGWPILSLR